MDELVRSSHTIGQSCLHLQFTIAYRRQVIRVEQLDKLVKIYLRAGADRIGVNIAALEVAPDHVHVFVSNWKNYSIPEIAKRLKGFSSRMIRKRYSCYLKYYLWGKKFWSAGYFYRTVGSVTAENVRRYIDETQNKHWN